MREGDDETACPGPEELPREPGDLRQLQAWAALLGDSGLTLLKLIKAELALTLVEIPQIIALSIALVPFMLLAWVSFSVLVGWFAWEWSGEPGLGIFAFFVLQVIPCVVLAMRIVRLERGLFFPATKRQLEKFAEFMKKQ